MIGNTSHESRRQRVDFYLTSKDIDKKEHFYIDIIEEWAGRENEMSEFIYECAVYNTVNDEHVLELSDAYIEYLSDVHNHINHINEIFKNEYNVSIQKNEWERSCGCDRCNAVFGESMVKAGKVIII